SLPPTFTGLNSHALVLSPPRAIRNEGSAEEDLVQGRGRHVPTGPDASDDGRDRRLAGVEQTGRAELSERVGPAANVRVGDAELEVRVPVLGVSLDRPTECRRHPAGVAESARDRAGDQIRLVTERVETSCAVKPVE